MINMSCVPDQVDHDDLPDFPLTYSMLSQFMVVNDKVTVTVPIKKGHLLFTHDSGPFQVMAAVPTNLYCAETLFLPASADDRDVGAMVLECLASLRKKREGDLFQALARATRHGKIVHPDKGTLGVQIVGKAAFVHIYKHVDGSGISVSASDTTGFYIVVEEDSHGQD